jgi:hypothetical protein
MGGKDQDTRRFACFVPISTRSGEEIRFLLWSGIVDDFSHVLSPSLKLGRSVRLLSKGLVRNVMDAMMVKRDQ